MIGKLLLQNISKPNGDLVAIYSGFAKDNIYITFNKSKKRLMEEIGKPVEISKSPSKFVGSGQITIIPKPEFRAFWGEFPY